MLRSEDPELYLEKAVHRLCDYYGKALTLEYVRNKIAWALYQTWKEFDKKSEERRMSEPCEKCLYYSICENLQKDGCSNFAPILEPRGRKRGVLFQRRKERRMRMPDGMVYIYKPEKFTINLESKELVFCKNCIWYDPPHIDKDGVRYEYRDMPSEAFDDLGTGLVNSNFGINVGGKCFRDCDRGYSEDKSVFREENDFCSKAERRES